MVGVHLDGLGSCLGNLWGYLDDGNGYFDRDAVQVGGMRSEEFTTRYFRFDRGLVRVRVYGREL